MQSDRLTINNIDLSSTVEEVTSEVVGFTIANCPAGPKTPILIKNSTNLRNIFGSSSSAYPELYEVEKFISGGYSCYVGNSSVDTNNAYVPCIIVTNSGYVYTKVKYTTSEITSSAPTAYIPSGEGATAKYYYYLPVTYIEASGSAAAKLKIDISSVPFADSEMSIKIEAFCKDGSYYTIPNVLTLTSQDQTNKYIEVGGSSLNGIFTNISGLDPDSLNDMTFYCSKSTAPAQSSIIAYILSKYPSSTPVTTYEIESCAESNLDGTITAINRRDVVKITSSRYNRYDAIDFTVNEILGTFGTESSISVKSFDESNDDYRNQIAFNVIYTGNSFSNPIVIDKAYLVCGSFDDSSSSMGIASNNSIIKEWDIANDSLYDDVDIFFDPEYRETSVTTITSSFFGLAKTHNLAGFIFNQTVKSSDLKSNSNFVTKLNYGKQYWNVCGSAVVLNKNRYLTTSLVGAKALLQAQIIENYNGGQAPMFTTGNLNENIIKLNYRYTKEQQTLLDKFNYNPVIYDNAFGLMSTSQKTCKDGATTDWSYIGHASAFLNFEKEVFNSVMIPQLGKPNNPYYRELRKQQVEHLLEERLVTNRIWAEGIVDTSTAEGINDEYNRKARKFIISVKVKVDIFSEYVTLNFTNVDQSVTLA